MMIFSFFSASQAAAAENRVVNPGVEVAKGREAPIGWTFTKKDGTGLLSDVQHQATKGDWQ